MARMCTKLIQKKLFNIAIQDLSQFFFSNEYSKIGNNPSRLLQPEPQFEGFKSR